MLYSDNVLSHSIIQGLVIIALVCCTGTDVAAAQKAPKTVIHPHKDGGTVKEWLVLGPFRKIGEPDSIKNDSLVTSPGKAESFNHDFLRSMGGEQKAEVKNYSAIRIKNREGDRTFIKAKRIVADSSGIVSLDSFFTRQDDETMYAFCMVEAFIPCSVRCYWGVDGKAKVWINGIQKKNIWEYGDTCQPLSKYVDAEFIQGYNTVLLKFSDVKKCHRFTFDVWDLRDSLIPFQNRIHALHCEPDAFEIRTGENSFSAELCFNIPVPPHFFTGSVAISIDALRPDAVKKVTSVSAPVGRKFTITIPESLQGVVCVESEAKPGNERTFRSTRFLWRGDFSTEKDSLHLRYTNLQQEVQEYSPENKFLRTVMGGAFQWGVDWFTICDSLSNDEKVRQLGYIRENEELVTSLLAGNNVSGAIAYPLYLPAVHQDSGTDAVTYEASQWLNYKYPELYALPREVPGATEYRFWLYMPESAAKKRKRMPLILALADADGRGYDIDKLKRFGPGGYAGNISDFPFAVVTPQCRYTTLWDPLALKSLLDTLIASGRFNRRKVFITGTGMGAFTAWHLVCTFPEYFAGILPINGGGEDEKACTITSVSVWAFHGGKNKLVPLEITQDMVTAVKECGGNKIEFSIYAEDGQTMHSKVYDDPRIYRWFKKQ